MVSQDSGNGEGHFQSITENLGTQRPQKTQLHGQLRRKWPVKKYMDLRRLNICKYNLDFKIQTYTDF